MKKKYLAGLATGLLMFGQVSAAQANPVQWSVTSGGNDHWYEAIYSPNITWDNAQNAVTSMGGGWHLATITSQEENNFILNLFQNNPNSWIYGGHSSLVGDVYIGPWIGALASSNSSNDWSWITGETFSYSAWGPYEPFGNGDRIFYSQFGNPTNIGWNDAPHNYVSPVYIVENNTYGTPVPEPATMLLFGTGIAGLVGSRIRRKKK